MGACWHVRSTSHRSFKIAAFGDSTGAMGVVWVAVQPAMTTDTKAAGWDELSDEDLIRIYVDRQIDQAFGALVRRYQLRLFRVVVGMVGDPSQAEELCQRALVKAALRLDQLREGQAFYAWLITVARATVIDEIRSNERRRRREEASAPTEVADDAAERHHVKDAVRQVLAQMVPDDRLILVLADLEKHSMSELAAILECGESAAKMRLKRARERFRKLYGEMS